jgi:hypothetical protein
MHTHSYLVLTGSLQTLQQLLLLLLLLVLLVLLKLKTRSVCQRSLDGAIGGCSRRKAVAGQPECTAVELPR